MKPTRIFLFGGLKFQSGPDITTRFRTQKTATLLAYLALHPGPQPREILADLLWPDDAPEAARHSLRMALSSLRTQLEKPDQPPLFESNRFALGLRADAISTDIAEFHEAIKNARRAFDLNQRALHYGAAVALASEPFLPGFYDDWCVEEAGRIENALGLAQQFLEKVTRREIAPPTPAPPGPTKIAFRVNDAPLATILVCDGADITRAQKIRVKAAGGTRFSTDDAALCAWYFANPRTALQCALTLNNAALRMALCTGEMSSHSQSDLWKRARGLLESAHIGQTVCCEATALFQRGHEDAWCRDLGLFHLPGARPGAAPERVFQLSEATATPPVFAPLQARAARGASVPRPLDGFFGRAHELAELRTRVARDRLTTLLGAGGAGKTRVALQLAATIEIERVAPFYGAVFWVALADVPDAKGIASALCHALHLEHSSQSEALDIAIAALNLAPATLLVMDNFEHLVEGGAALIEELLQRAPNVHALVTSRRLLGVRGETECELAPLQVPQNDSISLERLNDEPSVQLFCDRARGARPDFALTTRNAGIVVALCRQLEGIPLALELAAARVGHLSPARILGHLQARAQDDETPAFENLDFLHNPARNAAARHRTLRTALSWSASELTPAHQKLLARLCVFRGGCTAPAASHVCRAHDASHQLEELRARSLLVRTYYEDEPRYAMLETVRQYAQELAAGHGEIEELRRRHAHYFLGWARTEAPIAVAPDAQARVRSWGRVRANADNLRAALRWSRQHEPATAIQLILACHDFSGSHLSRDELDIAAPLKIVEAQAIEAQNIERGIWAEALKLASVQAAHHGDIEAQNDFALRHLEWIRDEPNVSSQALGWAYFHWGSARHRSGHTIIARAALQQSLELFAQLEPPHCHQCRGWTLIEMGNTAFDAGDLGAATADFEQCDLAFGQSGDRDGQASARAQLADVCFHSGDHARAAQLWPQVAAIMAELGDEREHEWRLHGRGKHAVAVGELDEGHELLLRALRSFGSDGQKLGMLRSLLALSHFWLRRENLVRARVLLQVECAERKQLKWPVDGCWEPLRQQLWNNARADECDDDWPDLATAVEAELSV